MGSSLSVSTVVDQLHVLKSDERAQALEGFWQHEEVRNYVKAKFSEDLKAPSYERSLKIPPYEISTDHQDALDRWDKDESLFWSSSAHTFIPNSSESAVSFILNATVKFGSNTYEDCLRRRFLALFWLDYFTATFPGQTQGFDRHYADLACGISDSAAEAQVCELRTLVKAGRRYCMLVNGFGEGILLTLPLSIARSLLEDKLPLEQVKFDAWTRPITESWLPKEAEKVRTLGSRIRNYLLTRCVGDGRPSKRQRMDESNLQLGRVLYSIDGCPSADGYNQDRPNQNESTSRNTNVADADAHIQEDFFGGNCEHNLPVTHQEPTPPSNAGSQDQDLETPQDMLNILPDQRPLHKNGGLLLADPLDTTVVHETALIQDQTYQDTRGPMLSSAQLGSPQQGDDHSLDLNPASWGPYGIFQPEIFMPEPFETDPMFFANSISG